MWTKRRRNREKQRSRNLYVNIMWENRAQAFYCLSGSLVTLYALSIDRKKVKTKNKKWLRRIWMFLQKTLKSSWFASSSESIGKPCTAAVPAKMTPESKEYALSRYLHL